MARKPYDDESRGGYRSSVGSPGAPTGSDRELVGQVAIITGAGQGIGRAIALAFGRRGANIVAVGRTSSALQSLAEEVRALGSVATIVAADLTDDDDIGQVVAQTLAAFERIDILVNNAALVHGDITLVDFDPALWRLVIETNLVGVALVTKAVLPTMLGQQSGKVINIASIGGRRGAAGRSAYRASKAGLINFTESVAAEVHASGVQVNCICPGGVNTEGFRSLFGDDAAVPTLMSPTEIAEVACFLASSKSSAITGGVIDAFGPSNPLFKGS